MRKELNLFLLVTLGAIPGALLRWQLNNSLLVNIIGCTFLGLIFGLKLRDNSKLLLGVGFCGSLTTFSNWIAECYILILNKNFIQSFEVIFATFSLGIIAATSGFLIGSYFRNLKLFQ